MMPTDDGVGILGIEASRCGIEFGIEFWHRGIEARALKQTLERVNTHTHT